MLVIATSRKIQDAFWVAESPGVYRIIAKPQDFVRVGDVSIIIMKSDPKRQV